MDKKREVISGLKEFFEFTQNPKNYFTASEKHHIIQDYLQSGCSKRSIWEKYTGEKVEHGQILCWIRQMRYDSSVTKKGLIIHPLLMCLWQQRKNRTIMQQKNLKCFN